ncbi:helix-turn-helix transcriptional regulator [Streptomyces sp. NPDC006743]|uniref:helix-turn-helix domain-containing protein n=1 Tax=Streptomyces sp. NPDC006743 TaxID=3154480 RepID=UPI003454CE6B
MVANTTPTVRRRRLGAELRRLRQESGLTSVKVAKRLMVSQPKISHIENGRRAINLHDVRALCALYGVTDQQTLGSLLGMAQESKADPVEAGLCECVAGASPGVWAGTRPLVQFPT